VTYFWEQGDECIADLPADGIRTAQTPHEAFCDGLKKVVAGRMSNRIVGVLEGIQIHKQHRELFLVPMRDSDRLANPVVQPHVIGQTSQRVARGSLGSLQCRRAVPARETENPPDEVAGEATRKAA